MGDEEKEKVLQAIGARIVRIRQEKNITQQELASLCDFEKSNMSRIEAGNTNMTVMTLYKIAESLNVTLSELLSIHEGP